MSKLTTAQIQEWLTTDPEIRELVLNRFGVDEGEDMSEYTEYCRESLINSRKPKKWKRLRKYTVGSPTDAENCLSLEDYPELTGGIVREFWLRGTDHVTVQLVEKDGKIVFIEDLSD